jgi:hypothetical protein
MTDVTEYTTLKQRSRALYIELKDVRLQLQLMEQRMIQEMQKTQKPVLSVISENRHAIIKLQDRSRRIPLTEADLKVKLRDCLHEQFGHSVGLPKIEEFAVAIAHRIWSERRVKKDQQVVLKLNVI